MMDTHLGSILQPRSFRVLVAWRGGGGGSGMCGNSCLGGAMTRPVEVQRHPKQKQSCAGWEKCLAMSALNLITLRSNKEANGHHRFC